MQRLSPILLGALVCLSVDVFANPLTAAEQGNLVAKIAELSRAGITADNYQGIIDQLAFREGELLDKRIEAAKAEGEKAKYVFNPQIEEARRQLEELRHRNRLEELEKAIETHVQKKKAELNDPELAQIFERERDFQQALDAEEAQARIKIHENDLKSSQQMRLKNALDAKKYKEDAKWKFLGSPRTLAKYGVAVASVSTLVLTARYGLPVFWDWVKKKLFKPRLVLETSVGKSESSFTSSVSSDELISPEKLKDEFVQLVKITQEADRLGLDYQHVLFYGPPGNGKTHAAKILARSSGLDYDIIAGSAFDQFTEEEALKELDRIFAWARKGQKGRLVFIDEADSLLAIRSPDNPRGTKMVNMFLSHLPEAQDPDIMFVFATNHPERLDPAIRSRISNSLEFDYPERQQIEEQLNLRFETEVESMGMSVDEAIKDRLVVYADNMQGFSGRDILSVVSQARNAALASDKESIDRETFDMVIERMIQRKETERLMDLKSDREGYFTSKNTREVKAARPKVKPESGKVAAPAA